jgi:hypothetical protein
MAGATAQIRTKPVPKPGTFRVLIGRHQDDGPVGCGCDDCLRSTEAELKANGGRSKHHIYRAREPGDPADFDGDLVESRSDLELKLNRGPGSRKFERVVTDQHPNHDPDRQRLIDENTELRRRLEALEN